jgi:hypothetical protein
MTEDRALTGKQYESVNGVELFRAEPGLDSIPQPHRKFGPFSLQRFNLALRARWLCTVTLESTWFRDKPAMSYLHVVAQFTLRIVPTVALPTDDSTCLWLCHEFLPPKSSLSSSNGPI